MRPAKNKEAIIEASLQLFCRKGFSDASIKEITDKAGVSPGNVYNYFKSKEEIFDHLFRTYFPGNYIRMLIEGIRAGKTLEEDIDVVLHNMVEFIEENPYFFKLVLVDANEFGGKHLKQYDKTYSRPIDQYFTDRSDMPEMREDIAPAEFTGFFAWLFYALGLTDIIYTNTAGSSLKETPVYKILLKVLQKGLK